MAKGMIESELDKAMAKIGRLSITVLPESTDDAAIQSLKDGLGKADIHAAAKDPSLPEPTIGLVIVPREAVFAKEGSGYEQMQSFWPEKVDFEIRERIHRRIGDAIVDARVSTDPKLAAAGLNATDVRKLLERPAAADKVITDKGEKSSAGALQMMIPAAFMALLLIAVMSSGQMLLTTTIEEKSSRVMEVLLSAVSPLQLMLGKIIGQLCVGLFILVVYSGMGIAALIVFSMDHLVDPFAIAYMILFFLIAYFIIGSMFAAIGSAVTELREAQTLMTPVMLVVMTPWLLWLPISRAPNSMLSQILSFVPGINPFVMVIRLTSSEPPPLWQTLTAIAVGLATAVFCAWISAKIFRVGVLMYGKPPNLRTLIKWVRMA
jgi:ABC-2 type transport system permease protein